MELRRLLTITTLSATICACAWGQSADKRSDEVRGMSGTVKVLPNAAARTTTVAFTSNVPLTATSSQIVFVVQQFASSVPPAWSGKARLFSGDGFLGIATDETTQQKWMFKFTDRGVPPSLAGWGFHVFDSFGIARYGETTPLTEGQIRTLAATGSPGTVGVPLY
jgi:hypothetical protein